MNPAFQKSASDLSIQQSQLGGVCERRDSLPDVIYSVCAFQKSASDLSSQQSQLGGVRERRGSLPDAALAGLLAPLEQQAQEALEKAQVGDARSCTAKPV